MQRTRIIGTLVFLISCFIFFSTYPVSYSKIQISLGSQSPYPGWIDLAVPRIIFLGQGAKVTATVRFAPMDGKEFNTTLTSRFEINMEDVSPQGEVKVSLQPDRPITLSWKLKPYVAGIYQGTLWIFADGQDENQLILAREITIETRPFIITRVENIRIPSGFGIGAGAVLFLIGLKKPR